MRITFLGKERPVWLAVLAILALSVLGVVIGWGYLIRPYLLLAAVFLLYLFARDDLRRLWNLPSVLLLAYVAYTAVSAFWAVAGKFFLNHYVRLFPAAALFCALVLRGRAEHSFARRVAAAAADVSAVFAFAAVEAASTGLGRVLFELLPDATAKNIKFESTRLFGLFVNANVEASIYAIGVLLSLALLCEAESRRERIVRVATAVVSAFAFVLSFSMGAMACFVAAVVAYLIAAGRARGALLARMLEIAVPTVPFAFLSSRFFNTSGVFLAFPLLLMFLAAAAASILELRVSERLGAALGAREKLLYGSLLGLVALFALYIVLAMRLGAPYTFGARLYRSITLAPGEHTLTVDADGPVSVALNSVSELQVLTDKRTPLYSGDAQSAAFTVPADSEGVTFTFTAESGTTLRTAVVDGTTPIILRYRLLPDFAANRLQGTLTTNSSVAVRRMLWRDGLRYWKLSPVFGHGLGSFETGITRVQDFDYETKYPHNHYIQVLLEGGVIGFALFLGAHIALVAALWKRRRAMREGRFAMLYAALVAEFVMNALQMLWDISMTNTVFLCQIFSCYALIVLLCAEPLGQKKNEDAAAQDAKRRSGAKFAVRPAVRAVCLVFPAFVAAAILGNIFANQISKAQPETLDLYLDNMALAAKVDLYEHNDWLLTYALQTAQYRATEHYEQANKFAARLGSSESNSVHYYLLEYYCNTQQFETMLDMPLKSAVYSASDESMWNDVIDALKQVFTDTGADSPLVTQGSVLIPKLMAYYEAWQARNAVAAVPIRLTEANQQFFDDVVLLNEYRDEPGTIASILTVHLQTRQ